MGRGDYLGEFEQVVLLAVARLGDQPYGMQIRREIETRTTREVSIGAVYATLDRLQTKGHIRPGQDLGQGRARRSFAITPAGIAALERSHDMQTRLWAGLRLRRSTARKP